MQFIFSAGSLPTYSIDRCFAFAKQAGFDGIELVVDDQWDTRQPDFLCPLIDRHQIPIVAVHSPLRPVPTWPLDQPTWLCKSVELAEAIGAGVVVHHLPRRLGRLTIQIGANRFKTTLFGWEAEASYRRWLETEYPELQARTDVKLCIENMPVRYWLGRRWNAHTWNPHSPETVMGITQFPHLIMDTTHLATWGLDPVEVYDQWRGQVGHIHLSNYNGRQHRLPEDGVLHLDRLLARMATAGYEGAISFEIRHQALGAGQPDARIIETMGKSLQLCRSWVHTPC